VRVFPTKTEVISSDRTSEAHARARSPNYASILRTSARPCPFTLVTSLVPICAAMSQLPRPISVHLYNYEHLAFIFISHPGINVREFVF
jgi:hypothetical protein